MNKLYLLLSYSKYFYADRQGPFADACIEEWSLIAWVRSNQKKLITLFDTSYTAVQQVIRAQVGSGSETEFRVYLICA